MSGRGGLTQAEAAMLWAAARFGGGAQLWAALGEEASAELSARHAAWAALEAEAREEAAASWVVEDRLASDAQVAWAQADEAERGAHVRRLDVRWQRVLATGLRDVGGDGPPGARDMGVRRLALRLAARELVVARSKRRAELVEGVEGELDAGWFVRVAPGRHTLVWMRIGVFALVESFRQLERREQARLLKELPEPLRGWAVVDLRRERVVEAAERARAAELFVALSRKHERWEARALHAGLYFVAAAAGRRLGERLEALEGRMPGVYEEAMWGYHRSLVSGSRKGLSVAVRRSLWLLRDELEALAT
jgi:hypothetical protein